VVVAEEPKDDTQVRVRVVATGSAGLKGRSKAGRVLDLSGGACGADLLRRVSAFASW
jgi:hypothetical protein